MKLDGPGPAGDALATRLVHAKFHEEAGDVNHVCLLIHHDHSTRAHDRTDGDERLVVDRCVEVLGRNAAAGWASRLHGLDFAALRSTSAHDLDDVPKRRAHSHLDQPGVGHIACQREKLGSLALLGADRGKPRSASFDDPGDIGKGLHVIDQSGVTPKARFGWIGRPRSRHAALAFDRVNRAQSPRRTRRHRRRCECRS